MDPLRETAKLSPNDLRDLLAGDVTWLAEAGRGRGDRSVICQNKEKNIVDFHENTLTWMTLWKFWCIGRQKDKKEIRYFLILRKKKSDHLDWGKKDTVIEHFSGLMDEKRTRSDHRDWGKKRTQESNIFLYWMMKKDARSDHLFWGKTRTRIWDFPVLMD